MKPLVKPYLDMVWHFAVIDGDLELSLSGLGCVHPELGRLTHDPIPDVRHADQGGIVHLEQRNKGQTKVLVIRCGAHLESCMITNTEGRISFLYNLPLLRMWKICTVVLMC